MATADGNYGFLSFLVGSRGCIGNVFAKVEFRCLFAAVIGRFEFKQDGRGGGCQGGANNENPGGTY